MCERNDDIILETKPVGGITGAFYVPDYQRGYRWGADEVKRLLDDVYQNGERDYCLQPVVVLKRDGGVYELVDGQQRLTTLYLIYKYMENVYPAYYKEPAFSLQYETRMHSAEFLKNVDPARREENIDFWFIAKAYEAIEQWFAPDFHVKAVDLYKYFAKNVKIIWYEVGENEDPVSLFTRLNIGKIPLTSAELVKAMFLSRGQSEDMNREKQEEIALQWDNIEMELHNNSLWYFLVNRADGNYSTRIDLILDLIAGKPKKTREKYYTFFKFEERHKSENESLAAIWKEIQHTFLILKDWFEDHELYHKVGYLIASEECALQDIYNLAKNKTKTEFLEVLDKRIKTSVTFPGGYSELRYDNGSVERIKTLLILFNVESVRRNGEGTQWFPFDKFKYDKRAGKGITWSLEHIHAQQSEGFKTQEAWKEWLKLHIPSVEAVGGEERNDLVQKMQNAMDQTMLSHLEFEKIQAEVLELLSPSGSTGYMHSIGNLALLNTADNAALNNSTFDVKRNAIVEMDKEGKYIPFCTKMVFLKYYTPSGKNQLHFWGAADREAYIAAINEVLGKYLSEPIMLEKESL